MCAAYEIPKEGAVFKALLTLLFVIAIPLLAHAKEYTINVGDKLHISVAGESEYTTDASVRPDGKIVVRNLGDIAAMGLTIEQVQAAITTKLKEYIRQPVVSVSVLGMSNSKIYVMGGGVKPVVVDASQQVTLLNLLAGLGDLSAVDLKNASVMRDQQEVKRGFL